MEQVVRGRLLRNDFAILMYPASSSLVNCTLKFPEVDSVTSFRCVNSADLIPTKVDMTANLTCECSSGSNGLNELNVLLF